MSSYSYMMEQDERPPGQLACGCWDDWEDHRCMGGRRPFYCSCGAPDDCYCPTPSEIKNDAPEGMYCDFDDCLEEAKFQKWYNLEVPDLENGPNPDFRVLFACDEDHMINVIVDFEEDLYDVTG